MIKFLLRLSLVIPLITASFAKEKVVLQLKWEHEFQFAGYYAAQWQGYYDEAGLAVEIKPATNPDGTIINPIDQIKFDKAQFAIGVADILIGEDKGLDLMVLAPIFQRSATGIFSLKTTPINNLSQLAKLRIAAAENDATRIEVEALFKARGYDINQIQFVSYPVTVKTLIDGNADAIVTYNISAKIQAKELGVQLNNLKLQDFGINFYGDTLYTSSSFARSNPAIVEKFVNASLKGWKYALENKEEIANRISQELPRHQIKYKDIYQYNLTFSEIIDSLILYPQIELGNINQERWYAMNERIRSLGIIHSHLDETRFFYQPGTKPQGLMSSTAIFLSTIIFFPIIFAFWYKRKLLITLLLIVLVSFVIEYQIETSLEIESAQQNKLDLFSQLTSISAKLEGTLQTNISMLSGFAAYISAEPNLTYDNFKNYAQEIFKKDPLLINFAAAKDLIVNYVYPLKGNEKVIGLDYRKNKAQRDMVMQTVNTGQLQIVGPINLVQGGVAFIGRAPIFTGNDSDRKLWGIISAPIDANTLYRQSGLFANKKIKLAIRSYDALGNQGPVFFGDNAVFKDKNRLQTAIGVGDGSWRLAIVPGYQSQNISTNILTVRLITIITTFIMCSFVLFRFKQENEKLALETEILNNQKLLENVGSVAKIGGWKLDVNLNFIQWSKQSSILLNKSPDYRPESLEDLNAFFFSHDFSIWKDFIQQAIKQDKPFDIDLRTNLDKETWLRIISIPSHDSTESEYVTGTMQDITDKVRSAKLIQHQATYDSLTNLPNRLLFNDRLKKSISQAKRNQLKIAVLFIDLDRFKPVNDNHGHLVGDKLLIEAANRIKLCLRESDTVSRLSGDEFGAIITDIKKFDDLIQVTEKVLRSMQHPYQLPGISLHCSASIGIAIYPDDGMDAESLLRKADQAMYEVKATGRNGKHFYTKEMQKRSEYRHALLNELIIAIKENELCAYYQPILNLQKNTIEKCEALARWIKPNGDFIPPNEFISLAEESGLVNKIDLLILEESAGALTRIQQKAHPIGLSINVSPRLFHTKDNALEKWLECIKKHSKNIEITVEITERLLTHDSDLALSVLQKLKNYKVKIAIDDFGTGYSSLSYLVKFPVDLIKIDQAFVDSIGKKSSAETLIETILLMAEKLDIEVVAEGIETNQQLEFLKQHNCKFGQGFLLGKPAAEREFNRLITENYVL